jgi:3-oxoadipate enol-lactonase
MTSVVLHRVIDQRPDAPAGAPVVLMLGSLGSTVEMWQPQVGDLSAAYRVVRVDTRGHGQSPVPPSPYDIDDLVDDAIAVLDDLAVERAHLVGLSLGGMTALRAAVRHPERVDRMVVLSTSALLGPAQGWVERAATVRAQGTKAIADLVIDRWFTGAYRAANPDVVQRMRQMVSAQPADGYAACCGVIERLDLRGDLPSIQASVLAIAGEQDPATPPEHLVAIADGVRDGQLLRLDQAAHLANVEQAAAVTAAILDHLSSGRNMVSQAG